MRIGSIVQWTSNTIPDGFLLCDGSAVSRTTYAELFSVIGTTYGTGDGSTTFNVPDYKGRVGVGLDSNDTDFDTLGETKGEKTHTLTINEMPRHTHSLGVEGGSNTGSRVLYIYDNNQQIYTPQYDNEIIGFAGGSQPHNIIQPSIVTNYIIKALNPDSVKISELESASSVTSSDVLAIVQNGETKKMNVLDMIYPVGSIYISTTNTNPSTLFGGTWQAFGQGRTLVGLNTSDSDFDTLLKAGGSKDLQAHSHTEYFVTNDGNRNPAVTSYSGTEAGTYVKLEDSYESNKTGLLTGDAGTGDSGNLQPYIVVSMWLRVG